MISNTITIDRNTLVHNYKLDYDFPSERSMELIVSLYDHPFSITAPYYSKLLAVDTLTSTGATGRSAENFE